MVRFYVSFSEILGIISVTNMTSKITKGKVKPTDPVTKMLYSKFDMVSCVCLCTAKN